jgi:hypothetical protein
MKARLVGWMSPQAHRRIDLLTLPALVGAAAVLARPARDHIHIHRGPSTMEDLWLYIYVTGGTVTETRIRSDQARSALMELLPYEQFSALRLAQFLPPDAQVDNYECDRQAWRCEYHDAFGEATIFCFADSPPTTLSGIDTELGEGGLPLEIGDAILRALRLPVDTRATRDQLLATFGKPDYCLRDDPTLPRASRDRADDDFLRFDVGSQWTYKVGFTVRLDGGGLTRFWIARKDLWVEEDKPSWVDDDEGDGE